MGKKAAGSHESATAPKADTLSIAASWPAVRVWSSCWRAGGPPSNTSGRRTCSDVSPASYSATTQNPDSPRSQARGKRGEPATRTLLCAELESTA